MMVWREIFCAVERLAALFRVEKRDKLVRIAPSPFATL